MGVGGLTGVMGVMGGRTGAKKMNRDEKKVCEERVLKLTGNIMSEPQIHWAEDMREANEKYKSLWIKLCGRLKEVMVDAVQAELGKTLAGSPANYVKESNEGIEQGRANDMAWWFDDCYPDEPVQDALWEAILYGLDGQLMDIKRAGALPFGVEILPGHIIMWPKPKKKKGVRKCQPK